MKFHVLSINYINDTIYSINDVEPLMQVFGIDELTIENIKTVLEDEDTDVQSLGSEYSDEGRTPYVTSIEGIRLIACPDGEDYWVDAANGWDEACKVIAEYEEGDVCFTPAFYEPIDMGITIAGTMPECQNNFALPLADDETFDPKLLRISKSLDGDEGEMHVEYRGQTLKFLGMGRGDEDRDYFEYTTIYLNGDII